MDTTEQTAQRVLRWRISGLPTRIGQAILIAGLCWLANGQWLVAPWLAAAIVTGLIDSRLSKAAYDHPGDKHLDMLARVGRVVSATVFALVMLIFAIRLQRGSL